jgi:AcrR family transcriptional regulator
LSPRTSRRPGGRDTPEVILAAARTAFASAGYDAISLRGIARAAGVDPALVLHYFHSKPLPFAAAMRLPDGLLDNAVALTSEHTPDLGQWVTRLFLSVWEEAASRDALLAAFRSGVSNEQAAATLRGFVAEALLARFPTTVSRSDHSLRATLAASQLVGLAMLRYVIGVEPLASADLESLAAWLAPTLEPYLTAPLP